MKEKIKSNKQNLIAIAVILVIALMGCIYGVVHKLNYLNNHDLNGNYVCIVKHDDQTEKWSFKFKDNKTFIYTDKYQDKGQNYWEVGIPKEKGTYQLSKGILKLKSKRIKAEGKLSEDEKSFTIRKTKKERSSVITPFTSHLRTGLTFKVDE
jgi:hypothetical protein